jgi:hypothetical protein
MTACAGAASPPDHAGWVRGHPAVWSAFGWNPPTPIAVTTGPIPARLVPRDGALAAGTDNAASPRVADAEDPRGWSATAAAAVRAARGAHAPNAAPDRRHGVLLAIGVAVGSPRRWWQAASHRTARLDRAAGCR